jgi:putative membrane protein
MGDRFERAALAVLVAFTVLSVGGYATFGLHPELLRGSAMAQQVYGVAFVLFARGQVLLAGAVLLAVLARRAGAAWVGAFVAIYLVSLSSELAGTTVGLPFGPYSYTDGLGPKWFAHVPLLIPLSWFLMAVPSYAIARRLTASTPARVLLGSFVLLAWDLALDPAMSFATKYWVWGASGPYYGMPWLNLLGWYVTGLALMAILALTRSDAWLARVPFGWITGYYVANLALSLGMCASAGLWGAVAASGLPLLLCVAALRRERDGAPVMSEVMA